MTLSLSRRIDSFYVKPEATNFTRTYSFFKVANYMNGGHYSPHFDYVMKDKDPDHVSRIKFMFIKVHGGFSHGDLKGENVNERDKISLLQM